VTTLESTTERLTDALGRLAVEAADVFEELLRSGAELPFDLEVSRSDESPMPMYSYAPLTGEFIERHLAEVRRLEAFVEVREVAGEDAAIGFMVELWDGRAEFEIAGDRLQGAIQGVLSCISSDEGEGTPAGEIVVPLVGFHMPKDELTLDGVRIVRADSIDDLPLDAVEAARSVRGRKSCFIARVSCGVAAVAPAAAVADDLRRVLRTLRLFRPGAVGVAAHGWARRAGGWERFGTGAGRARQGGYRLTGAEAAGLERCTKTLTERGARLPALAWAASRFELGAERASLIEALSDYLLALRGLLEGGGPANTALSARVAALACKPSERDHGRICVERALALERKLMSGARYRPAGDSSPLEVIAELEELLRRLLKGLATGELSGDLRAAADESLLSHGLGVAETIRPSRGETAEWRLPDLTSDEDSDGLDLSVIADGHAGEIDVRRTADDPESGEVLGEETNDMTRIIVDHVELPEIVAADSDQPSTPEDERPSPPEESRADWFSAGDGEVEWPAFASPRSDRNGRSKRERERPKHSDTVRHLFPVPDATDWDVGELRYERRKNV
jgi:hypothetical protein